MKRTGIALALMGVVAFAGPLKAAPILTEGFDNIATLSGSGWATVQNSTPGGTTTWFQGNPGIFSALTGASNSYIGANYLAAPDGGAISLWLLTPQLTLTNGTTLSFATRTPGDGLGYADRLDVMLSTNGASTNVGSTTTSVGDFTTTLLTVNPSLDPSASGYPSAWTTFTVTVSGLGSPTTGRFGFRYDVPSTTTNGDYIGIDNVVVDNAAAVPLPASAWLLLSGVAGLFLLRRRQLAAQF